MDIKTKSHAGGNQLTLKTTSKRYSTHIACRLKAALLTLAVWGWFPIKLVEWINRMGGPCDE